MKDKELRIKLVDNIAELELDIAESMHLGEQGFPVGTMLRMSNMFLEEASRELKDLTECITVGDMLKEELI